MCFYPYVVGMYGTLGLIFLTDFLLAVNLRRKFACRELQKTNTVPCLLENLSGFFPGECLLPPTPNNLEFWGKNGRKGSFWRAQHCWVKGIEGMGPKPIKKLSFGAVLCNSNMKGFLHNFPGSFDLRCRVGMSLLLDMRLPKC